MMNKMLSKYQEKVPAKGSDQNGSEPLAGTL